MIKVASTAATAGNIPCSLSNIFGTTPLSCQMPSTTLASAMPGTTPITAPMVTTVSVSHLIARRTWRGVAAMAGAQQRDLTVALLHDER